MKGKDFRPRSKYRHWVGWIWQIVGRCWHCGSKDVKLWNDSHLVAFRCGHFGYVCNDCNYITLKSKVYKIST